MADDPHLSDPVLEQLRTSEDWRVRALVFQATNAAHRVTMFERQLALAKGLDDRRKIETGIDTQRGIQEASLAGALALDNVRLSAAMKLVLAYIGDRAGPAFEGAISTVLADHVRHVDGGPMVACPRIATAAAARKAHPRDCPLCDGTGEVPDRAATLWRSVGPVLDTAIAAPAPRLRLVDAPRPEGT